MMRDARAVRQVGRKARFLGAFQPAPGGLFADGVSIGSGAQREGFGMKKSGHLSSRERSSCGISVHVVRAVWRWVEC